jgi:hypothetical protein
MKRFAALTIFAFLAVPAFAVAQDKLPPKSKVVKLDPSTGALIRDFVPVPFNK